MAEKEITNEVIARSEIAIEILNRARPSSPCASMSSEGDDPVAADRLHTPRQGLVDLQHGFSVDDLEAVEDIISVWGRRGDEEARFRQYFSPWRMPDMTEFDEPAIIAEAFALAYRDDPNAWRWSTNLIQGPRDIVLTRCLAIIAQARLFDHQRGALGQLGAESVENVTSETLLDDLQF